MYFTVTPKVLTRLRRVIFSTIAAQIYVDLTDRIKCEDQFEAIRTALAHLLDNSHFGTTEVLAQSVLNLQRAHGVLAANPESDRFPIKKQKLQTLMDGLTRDMRKFLNDDFTHEDIVRFASLAKAGRAHFEEEEYDPEYFIDARLVELAEKIVSNFSAYEKTLNHEHV